MMTPKSNCLAFTVTKTEGGDNIADVITLFGSVVAMTTSLNYAGSVYACATPTTTV